MSEGAHPASAVWARSMRMPSGSYGAQFGVGELTWSMPADGVQRYAAAVVTRAVQADHEAALLATLNARGVAMEGTAQLLINLRGGRTAIDRLTRPLRLTPGVSVFTGQPFLLVEADGLDQPWQWSPQEAREHALGALEVVAAADADALLNRILTVDAGLDAAHASAVIASLAEHWPQRAPAPRQENP